MLSRTRLYAGPDGRLFSLIGAASGDLSLVLSELMMRNDYALRVRDAEVRIEMIPEPGFAQVVEVTADPVAGLGSTLAISASLRVGRRDDRKIELELALPDTIPPGRYRLEVASAASLADDTEGDFGVWGIRGVRGRRDPGGGLRPAEQTRREPRPEGAPDVFRALPSP